MITLDCDTVEVNIFFFFRGFDVIIIVCGCFEKVVVRIRR